MARKKQKSTPDWHRKTFAGQKFVLTGSFPYELDRGRIQSIIDAEGGEVVKAVTADVNYVLVGDTKGGGPSAAEKKATVLKQNKGASIAVIDVDQFQALLRLDREEALAMLLTGEAGCEQFNNLAQTCMPNRYHPQKPNWLDLSNADLRRAKLVNANLTGVCLDGANFSKAELSHVLLDEISSAQFAEATVDLAPHFGQIVFRECNFRKATLLGFSMIGSIYDKCDLQGARVDGEARAKYSGGQFQAKGCNLKKANLSGINWAGSEFVDSDLTGADFRGASLRGVNFTKADLSQAKLQEADLAGADFTGAKLDGADFRDALIVGATFKNADHAKAKNFDINQASSKGKAGPKLKALQQAAESARNLQTSILVRRKRGDVTLAASGGGKFAGGGVDSPKDRHYCHHSSLSKVMLELTMLYGGEPDFDSLTVSGSKCPVKGKELKELARGAWCEAFGIEEPSDEEIAKVTAKKKSGQAAKRAELVELLKSGPAGVKQWNDMDPSKTRAGGKYKNEIFSQANLEGWQTFGAEFEDCDFSKAKLKGASLSGRFNKCKFAGADLRNSELHYSRFGDADFSGAKLSGASLQSSFLRRADFTNADLKKCDLSCADLRGANFSSVDLSSVDLGYATYDEKTVLPEGFVHRDEMQWKGAGHPPGLAEAIKAARPQGPIDLETFMERIKERVDAARLDKALKMLKAERFQLFADVQEDHLVGVVKSQSDPDLVYSARLASSGMFACCTQNLNICGGLRGAPCKHLLVLIIGLAQNDLVDPTTVDEWLDASRLVTKPELDKDAMSETFLRYKGAEAGEVDWRPTETVPEDYYAF